MTTVPRPASVRIKRQPSRATVQLTHPILGCPAVASIADWYRQNGRNVGLILEFPDGHTASLSYSEIEALQGGEY